MTTTDTTSTATQTTNPATALPELSYLGGTKAMTLTPIVGTPKREYAEVFIPGEEELEDGELRVTVLGSGNPFPTRAQASASVLVEVGNPELSLAEIRLNFGFWLSLALEFQLGADIVNTTVAPSLEALGRGTDSNLFELLFSAGVRGRKEHDHPSLSVTYPRHKRLNLITSE